MISIKVDTTGFNTLAATLTGMQKQVTVATAKVLTFTAERVEAAVYDEMRRKFDRPTPMTMRSLRKKPATPSSLMAMVYLKDERPGGNSRSALETIGQEFTGGGRAFKKIELWLQRQGKMTASEYMMPGKGADLDKYGNMSRGQMIQIMSQLGLGADQWSWSSNSARSRRNQKKAGFIFWSDGASKGHNGHLPKGIWARRKDGNWLKPLMIVARRPSYTQRINMEKISRRVIDKEFPAIFSRVLDKELSRAR